MSLRLAVIGAGRLGGFQPKRSSACPTSNWWPWSIRWPPTATAWPPIAHRLVAALRLAGPHRCRGDRLAHHAAPSAGPGLLEAGTHLLVEKPLCTTRGRGRRTGRPARPRQVVLQVGHVERFNPALAAAAPHTRNPKYIEAVRTSGFTFRSTDIGVVLDLMIHDIDLVLSLVRSPLRKVEALGVSRPGRPRRRGQRPAGVRVRLRGARSRPRGLPTRRSAGCRSGRRGRLPASISPPAPPRWCVPAKRCSAAVPRRRSRPSRSSITSALGRGALAARATDVRGGRRLGLGAAGLRRQHSPPRQPRVTGEAGRDALAVAEQILASIATTPGIGPRGRPQNLLRSPIRELSPRRISTWPRSGERKADAKRGEKYYSRLRSEDLVLTPNPDLRTSTAQPTSPANCRPGNTARPGRDRPGARVRPWRLVHRY